MRPLATAPSKLGTARSLAQAAVWPTVMRCGAPSFTAAEAGAEAAGAGGLVHGPQPVALDPQPVAHAVIPHDHPLPARAEIVEDAYRTIAPPKLIAQLDSA